MNLSSVAVASLLTLSLMPASAHSEDNKHTIGLVAGITSGEYKNSSKDGGGFLQSYLYYNYQVIDNLSVEIGYNSATEYDSWDCEEKNDEWTCRWTDDEKMFNLNADNFKLDGFVVALKGDFALSQRNSLYGKIGAQFYDYEFTLNDKPVEKEDGTGLFVEAGWQYIWDLGIGMNAGIRYQDMGDLTFASTNLGISYSF